MKRALLVGIDDYDNRRLFGELTGCGNDVHALAPLLRRNYDEELNFECKLRTGADGRGVTRDRLLRDLTELLAPAATVALLYFAGHGYPQGDDVVLATVDGSARTPGVALNEVLTLVENSPVHEVIIILDCCFSGAGGQVPRLGGNGAFLHAGVSILAATRGDQTALETEGRGVFSACLADALDGGAADVLGQITVAGLYAYLSEMFGAWDQRPTFKANVDRLHELRRTRPDISRSQLRRLARLFPEPTHHLALDHSYERTQQPSDPAHEADFELLQQARAVRLVEPVGEKHLYYAALNNKAARLTPVGRHYWALVQKEML
ncbi:caspase family protein [Candidatus Frankia nodulisporulans]|uniref:caspase family protein n=1 Tax=Candidatus Frankia nodulisporulans TaxID=2060052 RepID=UPI0013D069F9|nr:caspase family protein [Candidatus Frankia nodulisporulans]